MRSCIGWLILMPFVGVWWLTIKTVDACIKKSDALRPLGIIISLLVGGSSIYAGYFIGPIVGWFIMLVGGLVAIGGTWRSLVVTTEQIERREEMEKLEKEMKQEYQLAEAGRFTDIENLRLAKKEAKEILAQGKIDNYERLDSICNILQDMEEFDLFWKLKALKNKQARK